jgi:hypothetical protein
VDLDASSAVKMVEVLLLVDLVELWEEVEERGLQSLADVEEGWGI